MASYRFQRRQKSTSIAFYGHPSIQACRLPPVKRSKPLKPLKGHFNGFLWASSAGESLRPWLFMGVQACRLPALQRSKLPKPHFNGFFMGFQRRQKLPQGQIHCCFWAVQRSIRRAFAANGHPKATSMVSYGLPAQAKATPRPDPLLFLGGPASRWPGTRSEQASQGHIHGFLWASKLAVCQPENAPNGFPAQAKATPRRDPLLFLGGPACRSLGIRSQRASQGGIQGHINGFLWACSAGKSYPKARSIAFSRRSSVPLARHSQPTGIRHQAFKPAVLLLFSFTTPSLTENLFPHTVRWSICPVFTSLATFPLQAGQT